MTQPSLLEPLAHGGYRQRVNRQLLALMLKGQFVSGERLVLANIARQLDVSITPIRESMLDLAALGMIEFRPNRGAVARSFGPTELREIYNVRRVLEAEATRGSWGQIPPQLLLELQDQLKHVAELEQPARSGAAIKADLLLHELIAEHCGNRRLREEIHRYDVLMQAVRDVMGNRNQIQTRAAMEHLKIVRALLQGSADDAALAMSEHIDRTCDEVAAILWPSTDQEDAD